jgi:DHA3 family macrolide efflux protein-like MFS transporter
MPAALQQSANWRSLLARRGFRYFFAGMMISLFGSGMNFASVTWFILAQTGSTVDVSIMLILATLPGLLVPVVGGVLIDRVDRRYLAITLDLARFGAVGGVAALIAFAHQGLLLIYTMVLFNGFCSAIYWATINALVQEVVGAEELVGANSALVIAVQCGWLMAGALVGFFYDRAGIAGILLIDSCTYAVSACCLYKLRRGYFHPRATAPDQARAGLDAPLAMAEETALPPIVEALPDPGFLHELKDGIRYLRSQPSVMALGFTYAAMLAGVFSANVLVVALAKDVLHSGARGFGALEFGWGFGALIGGLAVGSLMRRTTIARVLVTALAVLAFGHAFFPFVHILLVAVAMQAVFGGCRAMTGIITQSSIMTTVPKYLMGRTQSSITVFATTLQMTMSFVLGWLAERTGLIVAFAVLSGVYAVALATAWRARGLAMGVPAESGAD